MEQQKTYVKQTNTVTRIKNMKKICLKCFSVFESEECGMNHLKIDYRELVSIRKLEYSEYKDIGNIRQDGTKIPAEEIADEFYEVKYIGKEIDNVTGVSLPRNSIFNKTNRRIYIFLIKI